MRSGSLISILVALVLGSLAAFLARSLLEQRNTAPQPVVVAAPTRTVVVASQPIPFGAALGPDNLREVPWPSAVAVDGAFSTIAELVKDGRRLAISTFQRDEPILNSKITGPNQRATL